MYDSLTINVCSSFLWLRKVSDSKLALKPILPTIQRVSADPSSGLKRQKRESEASSLSAAQKDWSYEYTPTRS